MSESGTQAHSILVERPVAHVALVTINRPQARNAVDETVAAGLERALLETEADADVWAVVLTGAGTDAFCAGADLKAVAAGRGRALYTEAGGFAGFAHARRTKPWIASVNGFALAGGLEIALACDMIVAAETASFGLPEVRRGLVAAAGGVYRLPRSLPRAVALELIATGGTLSAPRAHHFGLVSRLAPAGGATAEALALAEAIAANAPIAVRESLAIARRAYDLQDDELQTLSDEAGRRIMATEDFREGPRAFVEKRPPRWSGR
jgi:enoyl-CoA hydratase/carnithine racemase